MKQYKKKIIYIIIGSVILLLVISGTIFYFWKKSKNQNNSSTEDDDEDNEEDFPISSDENSSIMGFTNYKTPYPPADISEEAAKKEVLKTLHLRHDSTPPKEIEKILLNVNSKMSKSDRENIGKEFDWDFTKTSEQIATKYQKDIFFNVPKQNKFEEC
jgi:flagellar basal body-associated protein FliL